MISKYDFKTLEPEIQKFWDDKKIYEKSVKRNEKGKWYFYLDGPPYTTGAIHVGHAWGKNLRDCLLRYKRMNGFKVHDQPGFDMHGLPIEVQVEKQLGIKDKNEIIKTIGMSKFIDECEKFAIANLHPMVKDFARLGVWLDWKNPYMTVKNSYIEGAWWALKKASDNGFLYEGEKAMTWCPRCATALAKHELEYATVTDNSIFVKFKVKGKENEFLIIWTTTPWTIPYNLAVMANPEIEYIKAKVGDEVWILAEGLSGGVINAVAGKKFDILEKFTGKKLEGLEYVHPLEKEVKQFAELKKKHPKIHTVVLSEEYVSLDSGSGLVHCAPGCGPEDYEVGKKYKIPPFNELDEHGKFANTMGKYSGWTAKADDPKFIEELKRTGALIDEAPVEHEYAHCWRCKTGVVYKTTKQWFLAVEKLKKDMIECNKKIVWVPDWAGSRWFNSWLTDLQDWCISRQRFWGIPLPIWKCECGNVTLIESNEELKKLSGKTLNNLHRPWIDEVEIPCKCGKKMKRIPDILDVWLDSGASPWATFEDKKLYDTLVADQILEGKDQIRGWFNSLMCLSMVARKKPSYKAVYMHGFINDSQGRKMSKHEGNVISPYEVIDQYGADSMRYYMIGAARPGLDMNYNFEDMRVRYRYLSVLWNLHVFLMDYVKTTGIKDFDVKKKNLSIEEKYIISKANSTVKKVTELFENVYLNEIPTAAEELFLELSRTYIQMIREKSVTGSDEEKEAIAATVYYVYLNALKLMAPVMPFITEQIYQNLKELFKLNEESIHLESWPKADSKMIDAELEQAMDDVKNVIQGILAGREKAQLGVRWPIKDVIVESKDENVKKSIEKLIDIIKIQTNIKDIIVKDDMKLKKTIKADFAKMGPKFGKDAPTVIAQMAMHSAEAIYSHIEKENVYMLKFNGKSFEITKDLLMIEKEVPSQFIEIPFSKGFIYVNIERTKELDAEGYAREVMRRVQSFRKDCGLQKTDTIDLFLEAKGELKTALKHWQKQIKEKVGASGLEIDEATSDNYDKMKEEKVKEHSFKIMMSKI